jgi:hypothetical protein
VGPGQRGIKPLRGKADLQVLLKEYFLNVTYFTENNEKKQDASRTSTAAVSLTGAHIQEDTA